MINLLQPIKTKNAHLGKPEALKYNFAGKWSRRVTDRDRLVYSVTKNYIKIHSFFAEPLPVNNLLPPNSSLSLAESLYRYLSVGWGEATKKPHGNAAFVKNLSIL